VKPTIDQFIGVERQRGKIQHNDHRTSNQGDLDDLSSLSHIFPLFGNGDFSGLWRLVFVHIKNPLFVLSIILFYHIVPTIAMPPDVYFVSFLKINF
jgi:hypothetical protein